MDTRSFHRVTSTILTMEMEMEMEKWMKSVSEEKVQGVQEGELWIRFSSPLSWLSTDLHPYKEG